MQDTTPTRSDALLAVAVSTLVAAAVVADGGPPARVALAGAFAAGFGALLLGGRRRPVAVLVATAAGMVAYYVLDLPPIGLAAPVAAALYLAAERGRVRAAAGVAAALLAVSVAARLAEGDDPAFVLGLQLGSEAVTVVAVIALGDAVRSRRSLRAELRRQADVAAVEQRREAARQVDAERVRVARELHDTVGHAVSVIALQSAVAQEAIDDGATDAARGAVATIREVSGGVMSELRATLGTLRAGTREPAPGLDGLGALAEGVTRSGLPVELRVNGATAAVPAVVGTTAYRIVQEALTNALRHAGAHRVTVVVDASEPGLTVEVVDDGRGGPVTERGNGLRGMAERVALLGGALVAGDAPGGGFRVHASLPAGGAR
ncbi:sensor histidine kinase [Pseudonocardia sp. KRD-184]|uniref:histidine kinase n=1 Tax=Pseudonocardia oceani TaxID=2792013 RepID=A0ABS6UAP3_9PSEU|nr:sensor histidine kinase [Pseudonocardia oceani]MBW0089482.1 sensor histidine kinase [Pseudonocardia oceani]MBW0096484.1 sensor histidine kinase [Pseudonocardia oceani]MBW0109427.1 sensor histidine kinase [Pseudonocardia oceani]MBW0123327.1 sensor histidine kinase [Pseudonocardia oceani]MBW0129305.1 sensor histidine kinase [Pseudonocardia oceani]